MKPITMYKTIDGKIFATEEEASKYEYEKLKSNAVLQFFDTNGNPIPHSSCFDEIQYIKVGNLAGLELLQNINDNRWIATIPNQIGLFRWNEEYLDWTTKKQEIETFFESEKEEWGRFWKGEEENG